MNKIKNLTNLTTEQQVYLLFASGFLATSAIALVAYSTNTNPEAGFAGMAFFSVMSAIMKWGK